MQNLVVMVEEAAVQPPMGIIPNHHPQLPIQTRSEAVPAAAVVHMIAKVAVAD